MYFLIYSAASYVSFKRVKFLAELIPSDSVVFLIATKCDLRPQGNLVREMSSEPQERITETGRESVTELVGSEISAEGNLEELSEIKEEEMVEYRVVGTDEGIALAQELRCRKYIETSAIQDVNVTECFQAAAHIARKSNVERLKKAHRRGSMLSFWKSDSEFLDVSRTSMISLASWKRKSGGSLFGSLDFDISAQTNKIEDEAFETILYHVPEHKI